MWLVIYILDNSGITKQDKLFKSPENKRENTTRTRKEFFVVRVASVSFVFLLLFSLTSYQMALKPWIPCIFWPC